MVTETKVWDSSEILEDADDIAAYLDDVLEGAAATGNVALITHALGVVARARGMSQIARDSGLARESLYKALSEDGNPSFVTVMKVLTALGVRLHAVRANGSEAA
jgi:probable addiction module antidote protein